VPADHKWFARVLIGSTTAGALEGLNPPFPSAEKANLRQFERGHKALENEGEGKPKKAGRPPSKKPNPAKIIWLSVYFY